MDFISTNPERPLRMEMNESQWFCNQRTCNILREILERFWFKDQKILIHGSRKVASLSYIVYT